MKIFKEKCISCHNSKGGNENNLKLSKPPFLFSTDTSSTFYKEVYNVYNQSKINTKEQIDIAKFWSDDFATTPACHSLAIANQATEQQNIGYKDRIIILLKSSIALNDAFINCFKNKYHYNLLRPVTYIQKYIDSTWNALIPTPPFPEYPSCHSTQTSANATILKLNLENIIFYDFSREKFGFPVKKINSFDDYAIEVTKSRLYGGVHYQFSNNEGLRLGKVIGENINTIINQIIYKKN
ncbi:MAG: vanadium-dependent haloperoxidase [Chitinophagales bacterium]|nr:vanadium-dependent haloperoxidase [Chitinophagales bacterium]